MNLNETALEAFGIFPLGVGPVVNDRPGPIVRQFELFGVLTEICNARTVVEVGSWEGGSAIAWCRALSANGSEGRVICIDTWLGSLPMYVNDSDSEWGRSRLQFVDGYPTIFSTFRTNIRQEGIANMVLAVPLDSVQGLDLLSRAGVRADLCYVDGSHDFAPVYRDLERAQKVLNPENPLSVLCGDDYHPDWSEVQMAVDAFAVSRASSVFHKENQFVIVSSRQQILAIELSNRNWTRSIDC